MPKSEYDYSDVIDLFAPYDYWTNLENLNKSGVNYQGDGWYQGKFIHHGTWAFIVKNHDRYLVYTWKFDPRPYLTKIAEANV